MQQKRKRLVNQKKIIQSGIKNNLYIKIKQCVKNYLANSSHMSLEETNVKNDVDVELTT